MILQALTAYYETLAEFGKVTRPGWSIAKVAGRLTLSKNGEIEGFVPMKKEEIRGKKTVEVPQTLRVPEQKSRASGISPNFLCDNSTYLLGIDEKGKPERSKECFFAAREKHMEILKNIHSKAAEAVYSFFQNWKPENAMDNPVLEKYREAILSAPNLIFSVNGEYVHDDEMIAEAWESYYAQADDGMMRTCLVTGKKAPIARTHGLIKGLPGAQSSGASLVGFNASAFCSYEKEQSYNAPVSEYAVYAYTTALNYLLQTQGCRTTLGDTTIVYWAESGEEVYQATFNEIVESPNDNQETIRGVFENLAKGWEVNTGDVMKSLSPDQRFYILALSPNAARIAVRFFYADSFGNIMRHLQEHYERMEIVRPVTDTIEYLGIWRLMQETVNKKSKDKKPQDNVSGAVLKAILSGGRYPEGLYHAVLRRIRAEQDDSDARIYKITRGRAAILKAYLIRNTNMGEKEEITVGLNENCENVAYILGRMFSVLEAIQVEANPGINSTIKDRYFNSACATPGSVFPIILKLKNSHMKKIEAKSIGSRIYYERQLGDLQGKINVSDNQETAYPKRLSLEEQGMFILGYYHQTQKRFEKREKEEK